MIEKIAMSLKDIANFSVLLFLFLFTFTLLGLELFANKVKFNEEVDNSLSLTLTSYYFELWINLI